MPECYGCAENNGVWCKICQRSLCPDCHELDMKCFHESEYLSPHQVYEAEFNGMLLIDSPPKESAE